MNYELLTLRSAFDASNRIQLMKLVQEEEPSRPRIHDPSIPRDLETIVLKAIAKDPSRRYRNAQEMGEDLRRFLDGEPIQARRTTFFERSRLWCQRYPALAGLYVVLVIAVVGASATAIYTNHLLRDKDAAEKRAVEDLYRSYVAQANASRFSHRIGQRFASLAAIRKAADIARERGMPPERFDELRNLAISSLALPDFRPIDEWPLFDNRMGEHWEVDAEHQLVTTISRDETIIVFRVADRKEIARVPAVGCGVSRLSADGRFLAASGNHRVSVWDLRSHQKKVWEAHEDGWDFHPDSRHIASFRADGTLLFHDLLGDEPERKLATRKDQPSFPGASYPTFDHSGKTIAVLGEREVQLIDVATGTPLKSLALPAGCKHLSWHPSGKYVALRLEESIEIWEVDRNRRVNEMERLSSMGMWTAFTPDGELLVSWGWDGKLRFWNIHTGKFLFQLSNAGTPKFGPHGRCLFRTDNRLVFAEFATGREYRTLSHHITKRPEEAYSEALHPGGRLLVLLLDDGLHFLDLDAEEEIGSLAGFAISACAFTASGELLINSVLGLYSLPIHQDINDESVFRIERLLRVNDGSNAGFASSRDGQVIAQVRQKTIDVISRARGLVQVDRVDGEFEGVRATAMSPDGLWFATLPFRGDGVIGIWDRMTRAKIHEYPIGNLSAGRFSPDNRWLAISGRQGGRMIAVGDWEQSRSIQSYGGNAFSPSSDLFASESNQGVIRFHDPATGQELARLEDPNQHNSDWLAFTPDGTRIVTSCRDARVSHVWDLRLIRHQLVELGLDWMTKPFDEIDAEKVSVTSKLRVVFDPNMLQGLPQSEKLRQLAQARQTRGDFADALKSLRQAATIYPNNDRTHDGIAWILLTGPMALRDAKTALVHAKKAAELSQGLHADILNTFGVALYRNGQFREALAPLEKSLATNEESIQLLDLFALAICHQRVGDSVRAKNAYDKAVQLFEKYRNRGTPREIVEMTAFQEEAKAALLCTIDKP